MIVFDSANLPYNQTKPNFVTTAASIGDAISILIRDDCALGCVVEGEEYTRLVPRTMFSIINLDTSLLDLDTILAPSKHAVANKFANILGKPPDFIDIVSHKGSKNFHFHTDSCALTFVTGVINAETFYTTRETHAAEIHEPTKEQLPLSKHCVVTERNANCDVPTEAAPTRSIFLFKGDLWSDEATGLIHSPPNGNQRSIAIIGGYKNFDQSFFKSARVRMS